MNDYTLVLVTLCLSTAVDFVCDHPDIRAISFVGSDRVGKYIYERGSANGKRVQSNMVCMYVCILSYVCLFVCNRLATKVFIGKLSAMG